MASILLDQSRVLGSQIEAPVATHFTGAGFHPLDHRRHELLHQARKSKRLWQRIPPVI
jgi:hypothetical protein